MSEDELRIAGAEKAIIALAPWLTDRAMGEARASLKADLAVTPDPEERTACLQALQLIADGQQRFRLFNLGAWVHAPG
jgi:uncharacterized protein (DUF934 family)